MLLLFCVLGIIFLKKIFMKINQLLNLYVKTEQ